MQLIKRRGTLVVVSAPSGAGKTTLCHEVRSLVPDLYYSVSYTTRQPRQGETSGTDFFFVTDGIFIAMRGRDEFARLLDEGGPVGRTLDFLIQEMHREVNTVGSKADDLELSQAAIAAKSALEKIREQVQNIE